MVELSEDIGAKVIEELEELSRRIELSVKQKKEYEKNFPRFPKNPSETEKSQLHLTLESSLLENLKKVADSKDISLEDYCLRRLRGIF